MTAETSILAHVDHLILGTPDLEATVSDLESRWGVRATAGGQHPGRGTRNALIGLGPRRYLEILAPDPLQPNPEGPRWMGIDALSAPRLVSWAARAASLEERVALAAARGIDLGGVHEGGRRTPSGASLRWRVTAVEGRPGNGVIPFFIDWGDSRHPADDVPHAATLLTFHAEHPEAESLCATLAALDLPLSVAKAEGAALIAVFETARGRVTLR